MGIKRVIAGLLIVTLMAVTSFSVNADDLIDTDANTSVSGWAYSSLLGHRGSKIMTYCFTDSSVQNKYGSLAESAKALWGSYVNVVLISSGANLVIHEYSDPTSTTTAYTTVVSVDSNNHRTGIAIYINDPWFNLSGHTNEGKKRTLAHEMGHAFGLGHVSNSASIMNGGYSTTKNVTSDDQHGMSVVTHAHVHGTDTVGIYSFKNAATHYTVCNYCLGKYTQVHILNPAHTVCTRCGYTGPFSVIPNYCPNCDEEFVPLELYLSE